MDENKRDATLDRYKSQVDQQGGEGRMVAVEEKEVKICTSEKIVVTQSRKMKMEVRKESGKTEVHLHFHGPVMEGATNCSININK